MDSGLHFAEEVVTEPDPTHIQVETQLLVLVQPIHVPLPQLAGVLFEGQGRRRPHAVVGGGRIGEGGRRDLMRHPQMGGGMREKRWAGLVSEGVWGELEREAGGD